MHCQFLALGQRILQWQQCCYVVQVLFGEKVILHIIYKPAQCTVLFILLQNVHFMSVTDNYAEPVAENTETVSKVSLSHTADTVRNIEYNPKKFGS